MPGDDTDRLTKELMTRLQQTYGDSILCWRNNTGGGIGWSTVKRVIAALRAGNIPAALALLTRVIKWGLAGSADIECIIGPCARFIAVEIKTGSDRQSLEQKAFELRVKKLGGVYLIARNVDDCLKELAEVV